MVTDVENGRPVYILCFGSRGTFISKQRIHTLSIHSGLVTRNQPLLEQGRFSLHHQSLVQIEHPCLSLEREVLLAIFCRIVRHCRSSFEKPHKAQDQPHRNFTTVNQRKPLRRKSETGTTCTGTKAKERREVQVKSTVCPYLNSPLRFIFLASAVTHTNQ